MPLLVVAITMLSLMSFVYSMGLLNHELHSLHALSQPFGGGINRVTEQFARLSLSVLFMALSLLSVFISAALLWLATQPTMVG